MDRQTVINQVYANFSDNGDDEMNIAARLELLNCTPAEIAIAATAYGDPEDEEAQSIGV